MSEYLEIQVIWYLPPPTCRARAEEPLQRQPPENTGDPGQEQAAKGGGGRGERRVGKANESSSPYECGQV